MRFWCLQMSQKFILRLTDLQNGSNSRNSIWSNMIRMQQECHGGVTMRVTGATAVVPKKIPWLYLCDWIHWEDFQSQILRNEWKLLENYDCPMTARKVSYYTAWRRPNNCLLDDCQKIIEVFQYYYQQNVCSKSRTKLDNENVYRYVRVIMKVK